MLLPLKQVGVFPADSRFKCRFVVFVWMVGCEKALGENVFLRVSAAPFCGSPVKSNSCLPEESLCGFCLLFACCSCGSAPDL